MAPLAFLRPFLRQGSARLSGPPRSHPGERDAVLTELRAAFDDYALDIAGPPPPFVPAVALRAAEWAANACWLLLRREASANEIERALPLSSPGPNDHASADVVLKLLAGAHRRARTSADALAARLEELLRRWPLSGVLADIDAPPLTPLDLGGHRGLLSLYAERYATRPRPAWLAEPVCEHIELALAQRVPS